MGLAAIIALQPTLTGSPVDWAGVVGLLVFSVVAFAPLAFFMRGAATVGRPST